MRTLCVCPEYIYSQIETCRLFYIGTCRFCDGIIDCQRGNVFYLEANYQYSLNRNVSEKKAYNSGNSDDVPSGEISSLEYVDKGETLDETYSNEIFNRSVSQRGGLDVSYQKEKFRAQLGAAVNPTVTDSSNYHSEVRNNTLGRYIILSLTYRFGNFGSASGRPGPGGPMGPMRR